MSKIHPSIRSLLLQIMHTFPDAGARMIRRARLQRSVAFSICDMLNEFASLTNQAMQAGDEKLVRAHLVFMSELFYTSDPVKREHIDVYYVEDLFHGVTKRQKKTAWAWMPENLKQCYIAFWGKPDFL